MSIAHEETSASPRSIRRWNLIDRAILAVAARFGAKAKEIERFLKFAVVGILGAIIDFSVLNLLQSTVLPPSGPNEALYVRLATGTAFVAAVSSNFIWNRYWTYPDSRSRPLLLQLGQFFLVNTLAVVFRLVFVGLTYHAFGSFVQDLTNNPGWDEETVNQLGTNIAQAIAMVIAMFWNFFINRYWTYGDVQ
ncbi:MAG: GtrA family protein [Chloroflexi bacterium]|nr:GtrA family protein [Chloroflexota bacterium]